MRIPRKESNPRGLTTASGRNEAAAAAKGRRIEKSCRRPRRIGADERKEFGEWECRDSFFHYNGSRRARSRVRASAGGRERERETANERRLAGAPATEEFLGIHIDREDRTTIHRQLSSPRGEFYTKIARNDATLVRPVGGLRENLDQTRRVLSEIDKTLLSFISKHCGNVLFLICALILNSRRRNCLSSILLYLM